PVAGTYQNSDLNLTSLTLSSSGTGSVGQISAITGKTVVEDDTDRNGVAEISACFARDDFGRLFDQVNGKQTVTADVQRALMDGRHFCATIALTIVGTSGGHLSASVSPNPFNPQTILKFSTSQAGFVRIRMYDLHGRVVRTLMDQAKIEAGD